MSNPRHNTTRRKKQKIFLDAFRNTGNITKAARIAGVGRKEHYRWLEEEDSSYKEDFLDAQEEAVDWLELEAHRRAVEGVEEPVGWYQGEAGGTIRRYSDTLLIFLLKAARPKKYRDRYDPLREADKDDQEKDDSYL